MGQYCCYICYKWLGYGTVVDVPQTVAFQKQPYQTHRNDYYEDEDDDDGGGEGGGGGDEEVDRDLDETLRSSFRGVRQPHRSLGGFEYTTDYRTVVTEDTDELSIKPLKPLPPPPISLDRLSFSSASSSSSSSPSISPSSPTFSNFTTTSNAQTVLSSATTIRIPNLMNTSSSDSHIIETTHTNELPKWAKPDTGSDSEKEADDDDDIRSQASSFIEPDQVEILQSRLNNIEAIQAQLLQDEEECQRYGESMEAEMEWAEARNGPIRDRSSSLNRSRPNSRPSSRNSRTQTSSIGTGTGVGSTSGRRNSGSFASPILSDVNNNNE